MSEELGGKGAVVTGAASGIGRALSLRCADEGMSVVLADIDEAGLEETRQLCVDRGARSIVVPTDVSKLEAVQALADAARGEFEQIHLVFNNAGVMVGGCAWERSAADWEWVQSETRAADAKLHREVAAKRAPAEAAAALVTEFRGLLE